MLAWNEVAANEVIGKSVPSWRLVKPEARDDGQESLSGGDRRREPPFFLHQSALHYMLMEGFVSSQGCR